MNVLNVAGAPSRTATCADYHILYTTRAFFQSFLLILIWVLQPFRITSLHSRTVFFIQWIIENNFRSDFNKFFLSASLSCSHPTCLRPLFLPCVKKSRIPAKFLIGIRNPQHQMESIIQIYLTKVRNENRNPFINWNPESRYI